MRIDAVILLCVPAPVRLRHAGAAAVINAFAVYCHPRADLVQNFAALRREAAVRVRADVQDHIAALADALDQLADEHGRRLVARIIGRIAPIVVHGRAKLPRDAFAADIADALRRQKLLGADKIAAVIRGLLRNKAAEALAAGFQTVIDDDVRLMAAHHLHQLRRLPCLAAQFAIGIVEPEDIDLSIVRDQLLDLPVHIGKITVKVDFLILIGRISAHGMDRVVVFWEIRVVPVDQGVIQAHAEALGAHRVHKLPHKIAPTGGVRALIIRQLGIKQAEAVVMLGRQDDILHSGPLCAAGPVSGIVGLCRKFLHITLVLFGGDSGVAHIPFAASGDGIEAPMQEHTKTRILKPLYSFFSFCHIGFVLSQRPQMQAEWRLDAALYGFIISFCAFQHNTEIRVIQRRVSSRYS